MNFKCLTVVLFSLVAASLRAQVVFEHVSNTPIYDYLDEMANLKIIEINSCVKPYSRRFIMSQLDSIAVRTHKLNKRQRQELEFYLKEYVKDRGPSTQNPKGEVYPEGGYPTTELDFLGRGLKRGDVFPFKDRQKRYDLFSYRSPKFTISINPVGGGQGWYNANGVNYSRYVGAEMYGYAWKVGYYGSLRDYSEYNEISAPQYLTQVGGSSSVKIVSTRAREFDEARGGVTISHEGFTLGIIKDNVLWGNNYHGSNIHGGRNPSFPMLFFQMKPVKWFEVNYYHGWLASEVLDSARTINYPGGRQQHFLPKFVAANMYTFRPFRNLYLSVGNSIVYEGRFNVAYLIPFLFYKAVDHGDQRNSNAQMFIDISSRNLRKNHFAFTMYIDELTLRYITDKERHSNWWSLKGSWRYSNFVPNLSFTAEYTYTAPMVYKHFIPTTTYENAGYNMGHYLRDNSQEIYVMLEWKPLPRLSARLHYIFANKGDDYVDDRVTINPNTGLVVVHGLPFQENIIWSKHESGITVRYEIVNGVHVAVAYSYLNIRDEAGVYTAPYFNNAPHNASLKVNVGF